MGMRFGSSDSRKSDDNVIPASPFDAGRRTFALPDGVSRSLAGAGRDLAFGLKIAAVLFVLGAGWSFGIRHFGFTSDIQALKHIAASAGCDVALMIDAAPVKEGQPGYWGHLDIDQDTIACDANDPAVRHH